MRIVRTDTDTAAVLREYRIHRRYGQRPSESSAFVRDMFAALLSDALVDDDRRGVNYFGGRYDAARRLHMRVMDRQAVSDYWRSGMLAADRARIAAIGAHS